MVDVVDRGKVDIEHFDEFRISHKDVQDVLASKGVLTKALLHVAKDFCVEWIGVIENVDKTEVLLAKSIQKVLSKDPSDETIHSFLHRELVGFEEFKERG